MPHDRNDNEHTYATPTVRNPGCERELELVLSRACAVDIGRGQALEIHRSRTAIQEVLIADTARFGRVLLLDGVIQSTQADERLYHELLVQPAMLVHPQPRDVLIIGGGEGATLRETLAHPGVRSVTMVDIDGELVDIAREHLSSWHRGRFDDPRTTVVCDDGRRFVEHGRDQYDVVVIDVCDLLDEGPAQALYTHEFYRSLRARLRPGAVVVVQALEVSTLTSTQHVMLARTLRRVFPHVHSYRSGIPAFGCTWGFLLASDWCEAAHLRAEAIDQAIAARGIAGELAHLDGGFFQGCLASCKTTRVLLAAPGAVFADRTPALTASA